MLLLETVLPGLVAGIIGFCCLVAGVITAYASFGPATGNTVLGITLAGLVLGGIAWIQFFPTSRLGQLFVAKNTVGNLGATRPELLEKTGSAITNLRPSGTAMIDGKRVDVVTEGNMIERGTPVRVVAVEGLRVVVRTNLNTPTTVSHENPDTRRPRTL